LRGSGFSIGGVLTSASIICFAWSGTFGSFLPAISLPLQVFVVKPAVLFTQIYPQPVQLATIPLRLFNLALLALSDACQ
jgi:hypothetical protein